MRCSISKRRTNWIWNASGPLTTKWRSRPGKKPITAGKTPPTPRRSNHESPLFDRADNFARPGAFGRFVRIQLREIDVGRAVQHLPQRAEAGTVTRTVPRLFSRVPRHHAA